MLLCYEYFLFYSIFPIVFFIFSYFFPNPFSFFPPLFFLSPSSQVTAEPRSFSVFSPLRLLTSSSSILLPPRPPNLFLIRCRVAPRPHLASPRGRGSGPVASLSRPCPPTSSPPSLELRRYPSSSRTSRGPDALAPSLGLTPPPALREAHEPPRSAHVAVPQSHPRVRSCVEVDGDSTQVRLHVLSSLASPLCGSAPNPPSFPQCVMRRRRDHAWAGTARRRHDGPLGCA